MRNGQMRRVHGGGLVPVLGDVADAGAVRVNAKVGDELRHERVADPLEERVGRVEPRLR